MKKQAAAGGEIGANGEWYPGGAFIATTDHPKGAVKKKKPAGARRVEVENYVWIIPGDDRRPLWPMLAGIERRDPNNPGKFILNPDLQGIYLETIRFRQAAVDAWNAGNRWVTPHGQPLAFTPFTDADRAQFMKSL